MIFDHVPLHEQAAYNYFYYLPQIQKVGKAFDRAMEEVDPAWNDDIFGIPYSFFSFLKHLTDDTYILPQQIEIF